MFTGRRLLRRTSDALVVQGVARPWRRAAAFAPSVSHNAWCSKRGYLPRATTGASAARMRSATEAVDAENAAGLKPGVGSGDVLVIVESPAKARTISNLLKRVEDGRYDRYKVHACNGHVRNLVQKRKDVPPHLKEVTKTWDVLGVDVENGFAPLYVTSNAAKKVVDKLKKAAVTCEEIVLATDEDREGEAISWHLLQVLKPQMPVKRAVFHEITLDALMKALEDPRDVDFDLVQAQEARRILDRLAGFTLSPLMWRLIGPGLSAGRVQSVALAMVVERERARLRFKSAEYWGVVAEVAAEAEPDLPFQVQLVRIGPKALVTTKDFEPNTGELKTSLDATTMELLGAAKASALAGTLSSLEVISVEKRRITRKPPPPFITSTLQQEANTKLRFGATQTMKTAQALYEAGLITYMRTDRPILSTEAQHAAKGVVQEIFGDAYVRSGQARAVKIQGSQEAHEAIRPALVGVSSDLGGGLGGRRGGSNGGFRSPRDLPKNISAQERALYELVYRRTLASAMADSVADSMTLVLRGEGVEDSEETEGQVLELTLKATGKTTVFPGFQKAYEETRDDAGANGDGIAQPGHDKELPELAEGAKVSCREAKPVQHKTMPPRRFTEATFVKELEARGVGRPSTYAHILETLRSRTYATLQRHTLTPTLTGLVVTDVLEEHFPDFTDTQFTARMEDKLDEIARGKKSRVDYLSEYYLGNGGLKARVEEKQETIDWERAKRARIPGLESLGDRCAIHVGPYGGYLVDLQNGRALDGDPAGAEGGSVNVDEASDDGDDDGAGDATIAESGGVAPGSSGKTEKRHRVTIPYAAQDNLELLTSDLIESCLESSFTGGDVLGQHPDTGEDIFIRMGPYGPYLQCGEQRTAAIAHASDTAWRKERNSLLPMAPASAETSRNTPPRSEPKEFGNETSGLGVGGVFGENYGNFTVETEVEGPNEPVWYSAISLERAVGLLSLPRVVCEHPRCGGLIKVGFGRFGGYLSYNDSFKALPAGVDVLDVDEGTAVLLADALIEANARRPTIELGLHEGEPVLLKPGRFQKYLSCGTTKLPLPARYRTGGGAEGEVLTLEAAIALVEERREREAPATKKRSPERARGARSAKASAATGKKSTRAATGSKSKPTRPVSSFFRFCKARREAAVAENPAARLTSKTLSAMWKELPEAERARYENEWKAELAEWSEQARGERKSPASGRAKRVSAYALFCSEFARANRGQVPGGSSLLQMVAKAWKELDGEGRAQYERRARESRQAVDATGGGVEEVVKGAEGARHEGRKKPRNAYLMFVEEKMKTLREEGLGPRDCLTQAGKAWRDLGDDGKEVYRRRYREQRDRWEASSRDDSDEDEARVERAANVDAVELEPAGR